MCTHGMPILASNRLRTALLCASGGEGGAEHNAACPGAPWAAAPALAVCVTSCPSLPVVQVEKEGMKNKLRELERSVARIRDSSSAYERRAAEAAAELKAAALREQVGGMTWLLDFRVSQSAALLFNGYLYAMRCI